MLPSRSAARPWGPELSTFSGNSLNVPREGSTRPILFCICSVNQRAPSAPTAGSCGCAPLVGTSHSLMATCNSPTVSSGGNSLPRSETGLTRGGGVWPACPARDAITPAAHAATSIPAAPIPTMVLQLTFMNSPPGPTAPLVLQLFERTAYLQNRRAGSKESAILAHRKYKATPA